MEFGGAGRQWRPLPEAEAPTEPAGEKRVASGDLCRRQKHRPSWQAEELFSRLIKQMAERENVTEALKEQDQMAWTQKRNNTHNRAREIVNNDLIYN